MLLLAGSLIFPQQKMRSDLQQIVCPKTQSPMKANQEENKKTIVSGIHFFLLFEIISLSFSYLWYCCYYR